ncbi:DUF2721 domain-containing protein [Mangrovimonas spongiae]|uniref:DUF2721 domain-containing protein n=1 Tax=Mangrovimonas spongiae TaxID=2494697 RepID=A0A3R9M6S1_9FLAO|nr:DUF2721 domain-containing protein [Mangrovimonas spongiae]RSK38553.1 DUF2721 domain-containing protein [Mangrovimonas spongiae]
MQQLTLTTPALLFSAISLIMLAYTNRFLAYAAVVRNLHSKYIEQHDFAVWIFGIALVLLIISLLLLIIEIQISVKALEYHISDIEENS